MQDLVPCVQASGSSSEAGAPLKEFNCRKGGFAISPSVLGHDLLSSQSGLNHRQVGPPWMSVTGLIPCPEKQKTNPQAQLCHAWGWDGQEDAGEPHSQDT